METVRVAAVQAAPVFLDRDATLDKVAKIVDKVAADGARLVVFPESYLPAYPDWVWRTKPWSGDASALFALYQDQAVVVPGPATEALSTIAATARVFLAIGVTERDGSTLYCSLLAFAPDGQLVSRHRKLMPTGGERLVWGMGDGSTIDSFETPFGRVGGLICWENYMPLARAALYAQGIDIYLAPTWDNGDTWVPTLRHIAVEGRVFVIGVNQSIRGSDIPMAVPGSERLYAGEDDWLSRGNTTIVAPTGEILAGPLTEQEGILYADLDANVARAARHQFDPVGHYARSDILRLVVDTEPHAAVSFE